jgi:tRNA 2-selenouridine synthase
MFQDITISQLMQMRKQARPLTVIDVRSPSEWHNATIPGSINIPLFDDDERAQVGTIYTQESNAAAKERGLEIVQRKLVTFVHAFRDLPPGDRVVFCWRGGMRSRTTATLLSLMDIHVRRLLGGYKAYRQQVVAELADYTFRPLPISLNGMTGTGKTRLLYALQAQGYPVLDLEGMAGHRGSIFGHIGLSPANQRTFDALLLDGLHATEQAPYVFFEAESARIGRVVMPPFMVAQKDRGIQVWIHMPLRTRVRQLMEDYHPEEHADAYMEAFRQIKERLHVPVAAEIQASLTQGDYEHAISMLLEWYYDPRYTNGAQPATDPNVQVLQFEVNSTEEALSKLKRLLPSALTAE